MLLSLSGVAAVRSTTVADAEQLYADLLDARGAAQAIEAGAVDRVDGHDGKFWSARQRSLAAQIASVFKQMGDVPQKGSDARAVASMRKSLAELTGEESTAVTADCAGAPTANADSGALSDALYACFDSLGNRVQFEGQTMTRVAALQALQELDSPQRRHDLFMALQPLWSAVNAGNEPDSPYRRLIRSAAVKYRQGQSPIHEAAASFGISVPEAERWLVQILAAWRSANPHPGLIEPWDYRYQYSAASRALSAAIPRTALLPLQQRFYADLGADPAGLGVIFDIDPRAGKAPLAFADTIRIGRRIDGRWRPAVAWVSANDDRGGLGILNELVHETGHAVHYMAIRSRPAFFWPDTTFIEAFADVPSWSVFTPQWQAKYLSQPVSRAAGLREQYAGVMLDVAWSLFELRMLRSADSDPNQVWTQITQQYLQIAPHPEYAWWAVRSQLVTDPGYMIHYGLGAVITAQIRERVRAGIGPFDAGNPRWYGWISTRLLAAGGTSPVHEQLRQFLGTPLQPAALLQDIASIGQDGTP